VLAAMFLVAAGLTGLAGLGTGVREAVTAPVRVSGG
jgi:Tfp pilus assembly protein PilV